MFIHVTARDGGNTILVNLNQVTSVATHHYGDCTTIFFEGENYILVRQTVEELYDRIRSMSNGK